MLTSCVYYIVTRIFEVIGLFPLCFLYSVCLSAYLPFFCLSLSLLSVCLSSVCLCVFSCLSLCVSISVSVCLSVSVSVSLSLSCALFISLCVYVFILCLFMSLDRTWASSDLGSFSSKKNTRRRGWGRTQAALSLFLCQRSCSQSCADKDSHFSK